MEQAGEKNIKFLRSLADGPHGADLFSQLQAEAATGRITAPVDADWLPLSDIVVARRFGVERGLRTDGSKKVSPRAFFLRWRGAVVVASVHASVSFCVAAPVRRQLVQVRAVDDESSNGVSGCYQPSGNLKADSADALTAKAFHQRVGEEPASLKADIDAACHRISVRPEGRKLLWIAFRHEKREADQCGSALCAAFWLRRQRVRLGSSGVSTAPPRTRAPVFAVASLC